MSVLFTNTDHDAGQPALFISEVSAMKAAKRWLSWGPWAACEITRSFQENRDGSCDRGFTVTLIDLKNDQRYLLQEV